MLIFSPFTSCFFFSSRRRHTRSLRDWSSDVCSSDLTPPVLEWLRDGENGLVVDFFSTTEICNRVEEEIGRASCRERGWMSGGVVRLKREELGPRTAESWQCQETSGLVMKKRDGSVIR